VFGAPCFGAPPFGPPRRSAAASKRRLYNPPVDKEEIRRRLAAGCAPEDTGRFARAAAGAAFSPQPVSPAGRPVPAAVLVALVASPQGPEIILTQRTADLRDHPAQISLPGGRLEPEDAGPAAAALREAEEEVGLPASRVEILGCLPQYRTITEYCVHPFVGWVEPPLSLVPDAREVAEIFLVPLQFIVDPLNHQRETMWRDGSEHQYYVLPYPGRRIWGATAGILVSLAKILS
jgi:8-oxo-dGTP pyrophosphatase MutT (NUDIX family)